MSNNKDFKVKNGIQPTVYHEAVGTVVSGSAGGNLSGASYDSVSFNVLSQDTNPYGVFFNSDGTKMYMAGEDTTSVYQYTLSTAFDLSTASYDSVSFSVASQDTFLRDVAFNNDGTKMYIVGAAADRIYQYSLSAAFDLSTASYDSVSFSVASQDTAPLDMIFNNDGTKMYIVGFSSDTVYQYSFSTAFDLSTASYDSVSFNLASQDGRPYGIAFNNEGTKMFMVGRDSGSVHQYSLSTAFDLSTASYDSVSFSVASQDANPYGVAFNNDVTKMYILAPVSDTIYQYSTALTTAQLDLSTGSVFDYTPTSDVQVTLTNPAASGTSSGATLLLEGGLVSSYDIANAVYADKSFSVNDWETAATLLDFKSDGTKMYVGGQSTDTVRQYSLSTAWDITTASYDNKSLDFSAQDVSPQSFIFGDSGTKCYVTGTGNDTVYQYTVSTAWDISTASYASKSLSVGSQDTSPLEMCFNNNGTKMFVCGGSGDDVNEYTLSTAWDVSTGIFVDSFSVVSQTATPRGIAFNADGTKMFVQGQGEGVFQYSLTTAFDVSTASYDSITFDTTPQNTGVTALRFGNNGAKMYTVGASVEDTVYQYSTGSAATITYDSALQWSGGTAPTSPAIGETDVLTFNTTDGGTTYQAVQAIDGAK